MRLAVASTAVRSRGRGSCPTKPVMSSRAFLEIRLELPRCSLNEILLPTDESYRANAVGFSALAYSF